MSSPPPPVAAIAATAVTPATLVAQQQQAQQQMMLRHLMQTMPPPLFAQAANNAVASIVAHQQQHQHQQHQQQQQQQAGGGLVTTRPYFPTQPMYMFPQHAQVVQAMPAMAVAHGQSPSPASSFYTPGFSPPPVQATEVYQATAAAASSPGTSRLVPSSSQLHAHSQSHSQVSTQPLHSQNSQQSRRSSLASVSSRDESMGESGDEDHEGTAAAPVALAIPPPPPAKKRSRAKVAVDAAEDADESDAAPAPAKKPRVRKKATPAASTDDPAAAPTKPPKKRKKDDGGSAAASTTNSPASRRKPEGVPVATIIAAPVAALAASRSPHAFVPFSSSTGAGGNGGGGWDEMQPSSLTGVPTAASLARTSEPASTPRASSSKKSRAKAASTEPVSDAESAPPSGSAKKKKPSAPKPRAPKKGSPAAAAAGSDGEEDAPKGKDLPAYLLHRLWASRPTTAYSLYSKAERVNLKLEVARREARDIASGAITAESVAAAKKPDKDKPVDKVAQAERERERKRAFETAASVDDLPLEEVQALHAVGHQNQLISARWHALLPPARVPFEQMHAKAEEAWLASIAAAVAAGDTIAPEVRLQWMRKQKGFDEATGEIVREVPGAAAAAASSSASANGAAQKSKSKAKKPPPSHAPAGAVFVPGGSRANDPRRAGRGYISVLKGPAAATQYIGGEIPLPRIRKLVDLQLRLATPEEIAAAAAGVPPAATPARSHTHLNRDAAGLLHAATEEFIGWIAQQALDVAEYHGRKQIDIHDLSQCAGVHDAQLTCFATQHRLQFARVMWDSVGLPTKRKKKAAAPTTVTLAEDESARTVPQAASGPAPAASPSWATYSDADDSPPPASHHHTTAATEAHQSYSAAVSASESSSSEDEDEEDAEDEEEQAAYPSYEQQQQLRATALNNQEEEEEGDEASESEDSYAPEPDENF